MKKSKKTNQDNSDAKQNDLEYNKSNAENEFLTTNQGVKINDNNNSLKSGERGPSLLENFILREKITHFDHERIPERIVHARVLALTAILSFTKQWENIPKLFVSSENGSRRICEF